MDLEKKSLEPRLLDIKALKQYMSIGENSARALVKHPASTFTIRIGKRYLVDKKALDKFLDQNVGSGWF